MSADRVESSSGARRLAPTVVTFLGRSGSGKTSLLERLIPSLELRELRVGAVKHTSHGFSADKPGKDSHRLYASGAAVVALASLEQIATFTRRDPEEQQGVALDEVLAGLPDGLDVVLAEGFSWEPVARFVLVPESEEPLEHHLEGGEVIRIVKLPKTLRGEKPVFADSLVESLSDEIVERWESQRR